MIRNRLVPREARLFLTASLLATLACSGGGGGVPASPGGAETDPAGERVVAEVNGVAILDRQVEMACEADRLRLGAEGRPVDPRKDSELRRGALNLIINGELVYQAAVAAGMEISASEIDAQFEVVRSQFASDDEYDDYLESAGSGRYLLREGIERRLLMAGYVDTVTGGLDLDESEARRIYEGQKDRFMGDEQVRVSRILLRVRPQDPPALRTEARAEIDEARRRALQGEEFAELAREYSQSPLASTGGDMGYLPRGRMLPEFDRVAFSTPVGRISPVFETAHGFNLVKVLDRRQGEVRPFEEVKTELLMVLVRERQDRALRERVEQLRAEAEIRILDPDLQ